MRTRKNVANLCGRGLKAGTAHSTCGLNTWVAGKTIVVPCYQASYLSALVMTKLSHELLNTIAPCLPQTYPLSVVYCNLELESTLI